MLVQNVPNLLVDELMITVNTLEFGSFGLIGYFSVCKCKVSLSFDLQRRQVESIDMCGQYRVFSIICYPSEIKSNLAETGTFLVHSLMAVRLTGFFAVSKLFTESRVHTIFKNDSFSDSDIYFFMSKTFFFF